MSKHTQGEWSVMTKHTPGEWFIEKELPTEHPGIESNVFGKFFSVVIWGNAEATNDDSGVRGRTPEEAMANAHLISAAPDLLDALEAIMGSDVFEWNGSAAFWLQDKVKAAIAKAKGGQP